MGISQADMLNHLSTKFLARRSDIIVSSTLSIALTPVENYKPTQFALLTPEYILHWIHFRNKFRAERVHQQKLLQAAN